MVAWLDGLRGSSPLSAEHVLAGATRWPATLEDWVDHLVISSTVAGLVALGFVARPMSEELVGLLAASLTQERAQPGEQLVDVRPAVTCPSPVGLAARVLRVRVWTVDLPHASNLVCSEQDIVVRTDDLQSPQFIALRSLARCTSIDASLSLEQSGQPCIIDVHAGVLRHSTVQMVRNRSAMPAGSAFSRLSEIARSTRLFMVLFGEPPIWTP